MIHEQRAVRAFLRAQALSAGPLAVELRESPPATDPRSGAPVEVPPLVILWASERPLAVRVRNVVVVSRFSPDLYLLDLLEEAVASCGLALERQCEAALWRLFSLPPRPRALR